MVTTCIQYVPLLRQVYNGRHSLCTIWLTTTHKQHCDLKWAMHTYHLHITIHDPFMVIWTGKSCSDHSNHRPVQLLVHSTQALATGFNFLACRMQLTSEHDKSITVFSWNTYTEEFLSVVNCQPRFSSEQQPRCWIHDCMSAWKIVYQGIATHSLCMKQCDWLHVPISVEWVSGIADTHFPTPLATMTYNTFPSFHSRDSSMFCFGRLHTRLNRGKRRLYLWPFETWAASDPVLQALGEGGEVVKHNYQLR